MMNQTSFKLRMMCAASALALMAIPVSCGMNDRNTTSNGVNENGIYSEENPYIQTTFTVIVKDQYGEIVPGTKVYFKDDEREVSATQTRTTGADGTAAFTYSYGISVETGATTADYNALFALDSAFTDALAEQDIHLVLQQKKDLVLYGSGHWQR